MMTTDPGDLVLDPTCGSGTTAYAAERWGRRWITIDTSRVALALTRARIMGARYSWYLLADSPEGQRKEAEVTRLPPKEAPTRGDIRHGFVYERVPHITLKSIANNAEIDVIWERYQAELEPLRAELNAALKKGWEEWEIPREAGTPWDGKTAEIFHRLKREQAKGDEGDRLSSGSPSMRSIITLNGHSLWTRFRNVRWTLAGSSHPTSCTMVGTADRAPEGDRRLHRRQGGIRIPLRQALSGPFARPGRRTLHRRDPVATPRAYGQPRR
jgi:hypothetical protein